ncbi:MAG: glycosyltransferase family 1 protein [Chloroflexota bacterium]|nr:MAG: glycosyltransferase family 1 protein [Chloroflexota bacterium]
MFPSASPLRIAVLSLHGCPLDQLGTREVGGMQIYIRELSRALGSRGVQVDVFTRRTRVNLDRVVTFGDGARVIHLDAGPPRRIDKNSVIEHLPAFIENLDRFRDREAIHYDLVHSHYWLSAWVGDRLGDLWRVPRVITFHTLGRVKNRANQGATAFVGPLETERRNDIERRVARRADGVVVSTEHERALLIEQYGSRRERVVVIPPGADLERFAPRDRRAARVRLAIDESDGIVLFVGRIDPVKGLDVLFEAIAELRARPRLRLLVIGGSPAAADPVDEDERELRSLAESLGVAERVTWLGPIDQDRLPDYYSAADVCVVPSRYESFGLVALEALASGAVVIASRVGGLSTTIHDGENGILVPWRTGTAFADAIARVLDDRDLAERLRTAAPISVRKFSWRETAASIETLYRNLCVQTSVRACADG